MNNKEYRIVHELGPQFAKPMGFPDKGEAEQMIARKRQIGQMLGSEEIGSGWFLESRTVSDWEREAGNE